MIVGISGRAGSGKDTVGDFLLASGFSEAKIPFALAVKEICGKLFNISHDDLYNNKDQVTEVEVTDGVIKLIPDLTSQRGKFLTVRQVLQYFGTDLMRGFFGNVWVNAALSDIRPDDDVVITDVRFVNEAKGIQDRGGVVVRLTRNTSDMDHESETALDDYQDFDLIYDNANETPEETTAGILVALSEMKLTRELNK